MKLNERIKARREELNLSQDELAKRLGYRSRSTINKIELGINDVTHSKLEAMAKALETTCEYLMGWEENSDYKNLGFRRIKTKKIPMLGKIACGEPIYADEEYETFIEASENINADFCLTAQGDSMINARIFDGDIVFIRQQPDVENGEIAAVRIGDEVTLKRVYKYPDRLELRAENPTYSPLNFEGFELESVEIIGKAVMFQSYVR